MSKSNDRQLHSWKEIAAYFGYDQRTVKRWEQTRGLPVRRLPGARSGVFAHVSDLEAWQRGEAASVEGEISVLAQPQPEPAAPLDGPVDGPEPSAPVALATLETSAADAPEQAETAPLRRPRWALGALTALLLLGLPAVFLWHRQGLAEKNSEHGASVPAAAEHVPSAQARELYLDGRFRWNKRTPEDLKAALADFEQAVRLDPGYAAAYAGIADCYALQPQFADRHGAAVFPRMLEMANRAVTLDDSLAEGHRALGFAFFYWNWDPKGARREFERALALNPRDPTTHLWFANTLLTAGAFNEALREIDLARELDPASVAIQVDRGWILYSSGRHTEGEAIWKGIEQTDPAYRMAHFWNAIAALDEHRPQSYMAELRILARSGVTEDGERLAAATQGFRHGGERGMLDALADLECTLYAQHRSAAYVAAQTLARASRTEEALDYLEHALADRNDSAVSLIVPGCFPSLAGNPRYQELVARVLQAHPDDHKA